MSDQQPNEQVYYCKAWYYVPSQVTHCIQASCPHEAMEKLKELEERDPDFWSDQEIFGDGAGGTHHEVWNVYGTSPLMAEPGHELAPAGAVDLLQALGKIVISLQTEIVEFDWRCRKTEYTDTDVVWCIFDRYRKLIAELIPEPPLSLDGEALLRSVRKDGPLIPLIGCDSQSS